jgi:hypothetical protein
MGLPLSLPVSAVVDACEATVSPSNVTAGTNASLTYEIRNTSAQTIQWIRVSRPTGDYAFTDITVLGWSDSTQVDQTTLTNGSMGPGDVFSFQLLMNVSVVNQPAVAWLVQVSDDPGGDSPTTCTGALNTAITGHPPNDGSGQRVSNVLVSDITQTSAVITWESETTTTALVYYGTTSGYGSVSEYNETYENGHSVTLTGLSPGTAYHFQVAGMDAYTEPSYSGDNTFITSAPPVTGGGGGTGGTGTGGGVATPTGQPTEAVAPTVSLSGNFSKPFTTVPRIEGRATDNVGVAKVEYSTDGGENWSAVDSMVAATTTRTTGRGRNRRTVTTTDATSVSFAFTPLVRDDGNYEMLVRATDPSGNQAKSAPVTVIIDRLPPRFGTSVVMIGSQVIEPAADGTLVLPANVDFRVTMSMVGGPTTVTLRAAGKDAGQSFALTPSAEPGLWVGVLSFSKAGRYQLRGEAVDGAGNRTSRDRLVIEVVPPVSIEGGSEEAVKQTVAILYYLNPETHAWAVWDAATYGQRNPVPLEGKRTLGMLLPAGKYYLKFATPGSLDTLTRSFAIDRPTPLSGTVRLQEMVQLKLGPVSLPMPWTQLAVAPVAMLAGGDASVVASPGARLPLVQLPTTTSGRTVSPADWYGKPTVVVALATWAPVSAEQLSALEKLRENQDINVVALAKQQRPETVAAYLKIAGSKLEAVTDPDGLLSDTLTTPGIPALYFIDRRGIIKKVMVGVRSADAILTELSHL